jgi:hypothetical protein
MAGKPRDREKLLRQINRALILIAAAALLYGILLVQWRTVLIQARFL